MRERERERGCELEVGGRSSSSRHELLILLFREHGVRSLLHAASGGSRCLLGGRGGEREQVCVSMMILNTASSGVVVPLCTATNSQLAGRNDPVTNLLATNVRNLHCMRIVGLCNLHARISGAGVVGGKPAMISYMWAEPAWVSASCPRG
jgi:hypothetical protein